MQDIRGRRLFLNSPDPYDQPPGRAARDNERCRPTRDSCPACVATKSERYGAGRTWSTPRVGLSAQCEKIPYRAK